MLKDRPTPPNGYQLVDDGKVRKDDFVWDIEDKKWIHPKKYDYECHKRKDMICPHCNIDIDNKTIAKHLASSGGKKSKRKITPEQQATMQAARLAKIKERREGEV